MSFKVIVKCPAQVWDEDHLYQDECGKPIAVEISVDNTYGMDRDGNRSVTIAEMDDYARLECACVLSQKLEDTILERAILDS